MNGSQDERAARAHHAQHAAYYIHYTIYLPDGGTISSQDTGQPFPFEPGQGQVLPGIERAVRAMEIGEVRRLQLQPSEAFGEHDPQQVIQVSPSDVPDLGSLAIGQPVQLSMPIGMVQAFVRDLNPNVVVFDLNHPLAGLSLIVDVMLVDAQ